MVPTKNPTPSPTDEDAGAGAVGDNTNTGGAVTVTSSNDSFTESTGFMILVALLVFAIVAIVGLAYYFNYKNRKLAIESETKTQGYDPARHVADVAPVSDEFEGIATEGASPGLIEVADVTPGTTDPGFGSEPELDLEDPHPGYIESIHPISMPGDGRNTRGPSSASNGESNRDGEYIHETGPGSSKRR